MQWTKQRELVKLDNQRTNPVNTKRRYTKTPVKDPLTSASGIYGPTFTFYGFFIVINFGRLGLDEKEEKTEGDILENRFRA